MKNVQKAEMSLTWSLEIMIVGGVSYGIFSKIDGRRTESSTTVLNYDDSGSFGEYLIQYALFNISRYGKVLNNLYIPYKGKASYLKVEQLHFISYIIFSERCELMVVPRNSNNCIIKKKTSHAKATKKGCRRKKFNLKEGRLTKFKCLFAFYMSIIKTDYYI